MGTRVNWNDVLQAKDQPATLVGGDVPSRERTLNAAMRRTRLLRWWVSILVMLWMYLILWLDADTWIVQSPLFNTLGRGMAFVLLLLCGLFGGMRWVWNGKNDLLLWTGEMLPFGEAGLVRSYLGAVALCLPIGCMLWWLIRRAANSETATRKTMVLLKTMNVLLLIAIFWSLALRGGLIDAPLSQWNTDRSLVLEE